MSVSEDLKCNKDFGVSISCLRFEISNLKFDKDFEVPDGIEEIWDFEFEIAGGGARTSRTQGKRANAICQVAEASGLKDEEMHPIPGVPWVLAADKSRE